jgi:HlyD family secretion protein
MRHSRPRFLISLATLVPLATAATGCSDTLTARSDQTTGTAVTRVEVVRPQRATIRRSTEQPGQVEAYEETTIYARVSGYVEKWKVDIGDKVIKGQVLAVISVPDLDADAEQKQAAVELSQAQLAQAKASEEVAQANLASSKAKLVEVQAGIKRAEAELERWQSEFKRVEQLFSQHAQTGSLLDETRSKRKASESARDEVHAQVHSADVSIRHRLAMLDKACADVTSATASIKVARSEARRVQAQREFATIVAPYDGIITRRHVDVGDLTEPGSHGKRLFAVARDDVVRVTVSVPEMYATEVSLGDPAKIHLQALAGRVFEGKVTRTSWTLDASNRTLRTEIDLPNPKGTLRPGLYAYATITVEEHPEVLIVPSTAIVREDSRTFCVAVADGKAERKPVTLGLEDGTRAEIMSGLQGSEAVVKAYASSLADGQLVQVIEPPAK